MIEGAARQREPESKQPDTIREQYLAMSAEEIADLHPADIGALSKDEVIYLTDKCVNAPSLMQLEISAHPNYAALIGRYYEIVHNIRPETIH